MGLLYKARFHREKDNGNEYILNHYKYQGLIYVDKTFLSKYPKTRKNLHLLNFPGEGAVLFADFYRFFTLDSEVLAPVFKETIDLLEPDHSLKAISTKVQDKIPLQLFFEIIEILQDQGLVDLADRPAVCKPLPETELLGTVESVATGAIIKDEKIKSKSFEGKSFLIFLRDMTAVFLTILLSNLGAERIIVLFENNSSFSDFIGKTGILQRILSIENVNLINVYELKSLEKLNSSFDIVVFPAEGIVPSFFFLRTPFKNFENAISILPLAFTGKERIIIGGLPKPGESSIASEGIFSSFFSRFFSCHNQGQQLEKLFDRIIRHNQELKLLPPIQKTTWNTGDNSKSAPINNILQNRLKFSIEIINYISANLNKDLNKNSSRIIARFFYPDFSRKKDVVVAPVPPLNKIFFDSSTSQIQDWAQREGILEYVRSPETNFKLSSSDERFILDDDVGIIRDSQIIDCPAKDNSHYCAKAVTCRAQTFHGVNSYRTAAGCSGESSQATEAALGEAIERYCASFFQVVHPLKVGERLLPVCMDALNKNISQNVRRVLPPGGRLFSKQQHSKQDFPYSANLNFPGNYFTAAARLEKGNRELDYRSWIFERYVGLNRELKKLDPVRLLDDSIFSRKIDYWEYAIPSSMVYLPYMERPEEKVITFNTSAGMGAGKSLEHALLSGVLESVEKHSLAVYWNFGKPMPSIPRDFLISLFEESGHHWLINDVMKYRFIDLSGITGIPTVLCFAIRNKKDRVNFSCGSASDLDPKRCVIRAVFEVQMNLCWLKRNFLDPSEFSHLNNPHKILNYTDHLIYYNLFPEKLNEAEFIFEGDEGSSIINKSKLQSKITNRDKRFQLDYLIEKLKKKNHEIYYVILTTPDVERYGYHVVRVVIPSFIYPAPAYGEELSGLIEFLYKDIEAEQLNPLPHPFP